MLLIIWALVLVAAAVEYIRRTYTLFTRQGVKQIAPVPLLGDMTPLLLRKEHFTKHMERIYNENSGERFVGRYEFTKPTLFLRDIELLKKITVKDFEHFLDHKTFIDEHTDTMFGRSLFSLKGQEWKDMRSTLSPAFTSSKMKLMMPFMVEVGEQMIQALKKKITDSGVGYVDIDCKDLTTRYANDVIASCAFGLKVDSITEENNQFYAMGKTASTFTFKQNLVFFAYSVIPKIIQMLNITFVSDETKNFFTDLVTSTMKDRVARHIIRPDMINILMEVKKGKISHEENSTKDIDAGFATVEESAVGLKEVNRVWSDDDLVAQAFLFFIAGFETVSSAMSFLLHEIAVNPDVQERLYQEIKDNKANNGGKFDYNSIQQLKYMDMVVSETLRLWPPAVILDRLCIKDYNMGKPNNKADKDFICRKGQSLVIPVWALHRDPQYFPNPDKFDPERFSDENKHNIKPFTYLPFGLGPRNCIGSRFALIEVKVMMYLLLEHLEVSPCEKTCIPAVLDKSTFSMMMHGGHWIRLKVRQ
ncbi:cytochrome P450 9e2 [Manduca sexta]|uniref:unspecific monooxygenase n=1 Tax=Manduca sexta TaxID=7130 RepID=A0A922CXE8_MANSE|nr:cytochrome P450 9e2 [Manduca sexta]XP_037293713.1 cytochrome P450 9e2 [Manduca sexta]KAG6461827.1 hypothetical protein O3G_MSEX012881 [Manduca sexta]